MLVVAASACGGRATSNGVVADGHAVGGAASAGTSNDATDDSNMPVASGGASAQGGGPPEGSAPAEGGAPSHGGAETPAGGEPPRGAAGSGGAPGVVPDAGDASPVAPNFTQADYPYSELGQCADADCFCEALNTCDAASISGDAALYEGTMSTCGIRDGLCRVLWGRNFAGPDNTPVSLLCGVAVGAQNCEQAYVIGECEMEQVYQCR